MYDGERPRKRQRADWTYGRNAERDVASTEMPSASSALSIDHLVLPLPLPLPSPLGSPTLSRDILHSGHGDIRANPQSIIHHESFISPAASSSTLDEYAVNPRFLELQEELRCLLFSGAQSTTPTRAPSPEAGDHDASYHDVSKQILCKPNRLEYFKNYMNKVAPWLDMFDIQRHFGIQLPIIAQRSPTLLYAILALSARHIERQKSLRKSCESLELYSGAIRLLAPSLEARDPNILATSVILCCLEMMSASPQNWRRHLEGCAALFQSFGVHGFSGGLDQAVFWCYTRMDLAGALISDGAESTVLPLESWIPSSASPMDVRSMVARSNVPDMHANYAVYLCSRVCGLLAERTEARESGVDNACAGEAFVNRWLDIWTTVQQWRRDRPPELLPVKVAAADERTLFPGVLFAHWAAISSNQLYHTASILLLNSVPASADTGPSPFNSPLWHARRVIGISMSNPHEGCLNNSLQPLWIAGRLLSHRSEHTAVVELIRGIESRTGWGMCWRIKDLEEIWGYERSELGR